MSGRAGHARDPAAPPPPGGLAPAPVRPAQPALVLAGGPPAPGPMWDAAARTAMVAFGDGSWHLCRVTGWLQRADGASLCELGCR